MVTVQLPIFNEKLVAERLIDAIAALDYPKERFEIQVLDDSTDETSAIVAQKVTDYHGAGFLITHLHRTERLGYKAGALAAGLSRAKGHLLAVFDADFVPQKDFLRQIIPWFSQPEVGMVQARWGHLNRDYSILTRIQAILLDGHFRIEHQGRHSASTFFNFNGTAGVWRRQAIDDAGGWSQDTLTEDLDLSYRAQLAGWDFVYCDDVEVPAELPIEIKAFKSQQHRWTKGSVQTSRKLLRKVLRSPLPWRVKWEAGVHLTANFCYLLMFLLATLIFPAMVLRRGALDWELLPLDLLLFGAGTFSLFAFYHRAEREVGRPWWRTLLDLPLLMATGIGLSVQGTGAVLSGLITKGGIFHRTPKYRAEGNTFSSNSGYRVPWQISFWIEGLFALYFLGASALAVYWGMWFCLPFLLLFLGGYSFLFLSALGLDLPRNSGTIVEPCP